MEILPRDVHLPKEPLTESYIHVTCDEPVLTLTIGQALDEACARIPDHVMMIIPHHDQSYTISELRDMASSYAKAYLALGLRKGDRIIISGLDDDQYGGMVIGAFLIGLVVTTPYIFEPCDIYLEKLINKQKASALIISTLLENDIEKTLLSLAPELEEENKNDDLRIKRMPSLKHVFFHRGSSINGLRSSSHLLTLASTVSDAELEEAKQLVNSADPAWIMCSTGTTGTAKLICQTQKYIINYGPAHWNRRNPNKKDVLVCMMNPIADDIFYVLYSSYCLTSSLFGINFTMVSTPCDASAYCTPEHMLAVVEKYRCTHIDWYPFVWHDIFKSNILSNFDLASTRGGMLCSVKTDGKFMSELEKILPESVNLYSCCEAPVSVVFPSDILEKVINSVGPPIRHTEVKVVSEDDQVVPIGNEGEILVRNWGIFHSYIGEPELTSAVKDKEGWYYTGDVGRMDTEGYLYLVGRKVECIRFKRWGDVIHPQPIEKVAKEHHLVQDAVVIGYDVTGWRDVLCLCVVRRKCGSQLTEFQLQEHCEKMLGQIDERLFPDFYLILDEFPTSGVRRKVARKRLQDIVKTFIEEKGITYD